MEFYFCILISLLKSISTFDLKSLFIGKFIKFCEFLEDANREFLNRNGYAFKLVLKLEKRGNKLIKRNIIHIPLQDSKKGSQKKLKEISSFLYDLYHTASDQTIFSLYLTVEMSRLMAVAEERLIKEVGTELTPKSRQTRFFSEDKNAPNKILSLKEQYKGKLLLKDSSVRTKEINIQYLQGTYLDIKKDNIFFNNFFVRSGVNLVYRQHMCQKRLGFLPGLIFVSLIIEIVIFSLKK